MIAGTGHWLQLDKPEEYNQIMDEFLSSVDNGSHLQKTYSRSQVGNPISDTLGTRLQLILFENRTTNISQSFAKFYVEFFKLC